MPMIKKVLSNKKRQVPVLQFPLALVLPSEAVGVRVRIRARPFCLSGAHRVIGSVAGVVACQESRATVWVRFAVAKFYLARLLFPSLVSERGSCQPDYRSGILLFTSPPPI